jgi:hypothetical protein
VAYSLFKSEVAAAAERFLETLGGINGELLKTKMALGIKKKLDEIT